MHFLSLFKKIYLLRMCCQSVYCHIYWGADKSLARPGRKQARKHVRDARDFNNIETRAVIKFFFFLQGKAPKEIHAILTETLACFLPGRAKNLSAPLYNISCCAGFKVFTSLRLGNTFLWDVTPHR